MAGSTWTWIGGTINVDSPSDWELTAGPGNTTNIPESGDTAINTGTLLGSGLIAASLINSGTVEASNNSTPGSSTGGHLTIQGAISGTGSMTIASGATLEIDGTLGANQTIAFTPGAPETLIVGSPAAITTNTITGFALGDGIEFSAGVTLTGTVVVNSGTTSTPYVTAIGTTGTYQFTNLDYADGTIFDFRNGFDFDTGVYGITLTRYFVWTGATSTNFGTATNWNFGGVAPGPLDFADFYSSGGTISGSGTALVQDFEYVGNWTLAPGTTLSATQNFELGNNDVGSTRLTVGNSATVDSAGLILVAQTAGNDDLLSIIDGGVVRQTALGVTYTQAMHIGYAGASGTLAPADGMVLVSGAGSLLDLGANALSVAGNGGIGALTVQQGGTANAGSANSSLDFAVGIANSAGDGSILVTGAGSVLNATGYLLDGRGGTGSLTIQNDGSVVVSDSPLNGSGVGIGAGRSAGPSSPANVGGNGVATVTGGGVLDVTSAVSGITVGGNGVDGALNVGNSGTVLAGTGLTIGTATSANGTIYGGTGELNITAGGVVRVNNPIAANGYDVFLGTANASIGGSITGTATGAVSGEAVVSGPGALLDANGGGVAIGWLSTGAMTISQGASVISGTSNEQLGSALSIGRRASGSLTITDEGSTYTANGGAYVGRAGTGSLLIENHASLIANPDGMGAGGIDIGGTGIDTTDGVTYLLTGGSGSALVTSGGDMLSELGLTVGADGTDGLLTINDSGTAEAAQAITIGDSVFVPAGDSIITPTGSFVSAGTLVTTSGVVDVEDGGLLKADGIATAGAPALVIAAGSGAAGSLNVAGQGAQVVSVGQLDVGQSGDGQLLVQNQATVTTGNSTVDAAQGFDIAEASGGAGSATITGTDSTLSNSGRFVVGDAGVGSLSIQSGGTVTTTPGTVGGLAGATIANTATASGSSVTVTGAGSTFQVTGSLQVGNAGAGQLTLASGATATAASLDAGIQATPEGTGQISLSGAGSNLDISGGATIGDAGSANLSVLNGATFAAGNLTIGSQGTGSGAVFLSDAGSVLDIAGTLNVGTALGVGELTLGPNASVFASKIVLQGAVVNEGGLLDPTEIDITQGQSIVGFGTEGAIGAVIVNDGLIEAAAGTKPSQKVETVIGTIVGTFDGLSGSGELLINAGSTLDLTGGPVDGSQSVVFGADSGALVVGDIGGFQAVITNFVAGDTIVVDTPTPATFTQNGSVVSVVQNGTTLGTLDFATSQMAQAAFVTADALVDNALCFLAGTLIDTPDGPVAVERLAAGDRVRMASGAVRPVMWVGHGRVLATRGRRSAATPVIVRKGALGPNVPSRELRVTKGHSFLLDGVLIPVEFLVNHRSILWDDRAQEVSVYHVELETHDVLLANGAAAESYRDDGNRWLFHNANSGWDLPPQTPCAPVLTGGPVVDAVWRRLLDACGPRPSMPLTQDADLHLLVGGARVEASHRTGNAHVFAVDATASTVRLLSRAAVPQELGVARDPRCLGVAVRQVVVRQGTRFRVVRGDDARLEAGWHPFEAGSGLRWTDGNAALPGALFAGFSGPCELVVHIGGTTRYVDDGEVAAVA